VTEGGCDPVNSGNAHFKEPEVSGINNEESIQQWKIAIAQAIDRQAEVSPVLREVDSWLSKWNDYRENEEALRKFIDEFISTSLYGAIRDINKTAASESKPQTTLQKGSAN
jgi:hypothetical protein